MRERRPASDRAIILGALFVVCVVGWVGLLADRDSAQETVTVWNAQLVAATAASQPNPCLVQMQGQGAGQTSDGVDFKCLPGCTYIVKIGASNSSGGFFSNFFGGAGTLHIDTEGTPSKTKTPPGEVYYETSPGNRAGPKYCPADGSQGVASVAQTRSGFLDNFNSIISSSYHYEAGSALQPSGGQPIGDPTPLIDWSKAPSGQSLSSYLNQHPTDSQVQNTAMQIAVSQATGAPLPAISPEVSPYLCPPYGTASCSGASSLGALPSVPSNVEPILPQSSNGSGASSYQGSNIIAPALKGEEGK